MTIKNQTGDTTSQHRYIVYFGDLDSKVQSNSGRNLQPIVWFRTRPLSNNQQVSLKFTSEIFGFIGSSSAQSLVLAAGHTVNLSASESVQVGGLMNDGTELVVTPSGNDIELQRSTSRQSPNGTFTIYSQNGIPSPNYYVTGVARKVNNEVMPVAAISLIPNQQFVINPNLTMYVARSKDDDDAIVNTIDTTMIKEKVELGAGRTLVTVTNVNENGQSVLKVA